MLKNMKKKIALILSIGALAAAPLFALTRLETQEVKATSGYVIETDGCRSGGSTLPTKICLSPVEEEDVRNYYSSLFNLGSSELSGQNLLKNLRPILFEMNYYPYGTINSGGVSQIYTITERDWVNSPASTIASGTFNQAGDTITGFDHATEKDNNPHIHMLYVDYSIEPTTRYLNDAGTAVNFDKEHVWCQSRGFKASSGANGPAGTDLHHLIAGDHDVNSSVHSDRPYGYVKNVTKSGARTATASNVYGSILHTSQEDESSVVFEPQDSDKGDIARAIFYMAARYNNLSKHNTITQFEANLTLGNYATAEDKSVISDNDNPVVMGILRDLLAWNKLDPVDEFEIHRNDLIYRNYQGNRNPFIDFPQWADYIWGTTDSDGTNYNPTPTGSADPQNDTVYYTGGEIVEVTGVTLNKDNISLDIFAKPTEQLTPTIAPADATNKSVTWSSSNNNVATVSANGLVTAIATGNTTITVTTNDGGYTATCGVTVIDTTPVVTGVELSKTEVELDINHADQIKLNATVLGYNDPSQSVTWASSDSNVATVSSTGLVNAVAPGNATITATSVANNQKKATCAVTVIDSSIITDSITNSSLGFTSGDSGYCLKTNVSDGTKARYSVHSYKNSTYIQFNTSNPAGLMSSVSAGFLKEISVTFNTKTVLSRSVLVYGSKTPYTSLSDLYLLDAKGDLLATLSRENEGTTEEKTSEIDLDEEYRYIGLIASGGAIYLDEIEITWKDDGSYVETSGVELDISSKNIDMDESFNLTATVSPQDATDKGVTWSSSDEKIAYVDAEGKVTGISFGTATITADTNDGHYLATCEVTVRDNLKYKKSPYKDGVAYKMYIQNTGYFNGEGATSTSDYYISTDKSYSNAVDVYFETVSEVKKLYFMDGTTKKYIVAYKNNTYCNIGVRTEEELSTMTVYDWYFDASGHICANFAYDNNTPYTIGLKPGQTYQTVPVNKYSTVNRFALFEYTAESFASDFLDKITCDDSGVNSPVYATGYGWNDFKNIFDSLAGSQQDILADTAKSETGTTIQKALARYEYMVWKYHYTDFLGRDVPLSSGLTGSHSISYSSNVVLVVIIAISITTIGGALLVIKKKHE